jgi:hypothetical protein
VSALAAIGQVQPGSTKPRPVRVDVERRLLAVVMREPSGDLSADEDVAHRALSTLVRRGATGLNDVNPKMLPVESFIAPVDFSYDGGRTTVAKGSWVVVIAFTRAAWQRLLPRLDRMGLLAPVPAAVAQPTAALAKAAPIADPGAPGIPEGFAAAAGALGALLERLIVADEKRSEALLARARAGTNVYVEHHQHVSVEPPEVHQHVTVQAPKRGPVRVETLPDGTRRYVPEES